LVKKFFKQFSFSCLTYKLAFIYSLSKHTIFLKYAYIFLSFFISIKPWRYNFFFLKFMTDNFFSYQSFSYYHFYIFIRIFFYFFCIITYLSVSFHPILKYNRIILIFFYNSHENIWILFKFNYLFSETFFMLNLG